MIKKKRFLIGLLSLSLISLNINFDLQSALMSDQTGYNTEITSDNSGKFLIAFFTCLMIYKFLPKKVVSIAKCSNQECSFTTTIFGLNCNYKNKDFQCHNCDNKVVRETIYYKLLSCLGI